MSNLNSSCWRCYWNGSCNYSQPCQYYYIPGLNETDEVIRRVVARRRKEYYLAWYDYIKEFE